MSEEAKNQNKLILVGLGVAALLAVAIWSGVRNFSPRPNITTMPVQAGGGGRNAAREGGASGETAAGAPAGAGGQGRGQ